MSYDHGLVARLRDLVPRLHAGPVREKNVFSGWGFMTGTSAFAIAWGEGVLVKLAPDEYAPALTQHGVTPFMPMGGKPMGTWVLVDASEVADDADLLAWAERGLRGVRAAPSKRRPK